MIAGEVGDVEFVGEEPAVPFDAVLGEPFDGAVVDVRVVGQGLVQVPIKVLLWSDAPAERAER